MYSVYIHTVFCAWNSDSLTNIFIAPRSFIRMFARRREVCYRKVHVKQIHSRHSFLSALSAPRAHLHCTNITCAHVCTFHYTICTQHSIGQTSASLCSKPGSGWLVCGGGLFATCVNLSVPYTIKAQRARVFVIVCILYVCISTSINTLYIYVHVLRDCEQRAAFACLVNASHSEYIVSEHQANERAADTRLQ